MGTDDWSRQEWHVTVPGPLRVAPPVEPAVRWPADAWEFGLTALFVVLTGPLVGLVWAQVGPGLPLRPVLTGSGSPYRTQIGADFHFLLLSAAAGLLCAAVAVALRRDGPGVLLGLVVGGLGAALVADRVAYLSERGGILDALNHLHVTLATLHRYHIDPFFKVRALGVLVAWPMAALVLYTVSVAARPTAR